MKLQLKKVKMPKEVKHVADEYKTKISTEITRLVQKEEPQEYLLLGYVHAMRNFFSQNDQENTSRLLKHLNSYIDFAMNTTHSSTMGYLTLFTTILQNKTKVDLEGDKMKKFWNVCKENLSVCSRFEEYSQLVVLIVSHNSNEEFSGVMEDLLDISVRTYNLIQLLKILLFIYLFVIIYLYFILIHILNLLAAAARNLNKTFHLS